MLFRILFSILTLLVFAVLIAFTPESPKADMPSKQTIEEPVQRGLKTE